jgi:hypothetical protein
VVELGRYVPIGAGIPVQARQDVALVTASVADVVGDFPAEDELAERNGNVATDDGKSMVSNVVRLQFRHLGPGPEGHQGEIDTAQETAEAGSEFRILQGPGRAVLPAEASRPTRDWPGLWAA